MSRKQNSKDFSKINVLNFRDIPNIVTYFNDLLVASNTFDQHDEAFKVVVDRSRKLNIEFNKDKV